MDSEPIVPMAAIWYSDPIRPVSTYVRHTDLYQVSSR